METANHNPIQPMDGESVLSEFAGAAGGAAAALPARPADRLEMLRCVFLSGVMLGILILAWRQGALRVSALFSLGNPSLGESLAWKAEARLRRPTPPAKAAFSPAEWRLASSRPAAWLPEPPPLDAGWFRFKTDPERPAWRRHSYAAWSWADDQETEKIRDPEIASAQPPQKPATAFRAGDLAQWPDSPAPPTPSAPRSAAAEAADGGRLYAFPPLGSEAGAVRRMAEAQDQDRIGETNPPEAVSPLPPAPPPPAIRAAIAPPAGIAPPFAPAARSAAEGAAAAQDWRNREITGPIPGAYLTIYPKLKFIGLCVPGQGYVRKYNQVGVPEDLLGRKMQARDGRVPYGAYYLADRHRDEDGPLLFLSWPSPEDARRIGLDPGRLAQIDNAWRTRSLPPQNTQAGGGVGLNGLRRWVEVTEGGFALEEPHMEEIFTALPDGAWIFIQP